jgi:hypothetical protein
VCVCDSHKVVLSQNGVPGAILLFLCQESTPWHEESFLVILFAT